MKITESRLRRIIRSVILESEKNRRSEYFESTDSVGMSFEDFDQTYSSDLHSRYKKTDRIPFSLLPKGFLGMLEGFLRGRDFDVENDNRYGPILVLLKNGKYDPSPVFHGMGELIQDLANMYHRKYGLKFHKLLSKPVDDDDGYGRDSDTIEYYTPEELQKDMDKALESVPLSDKYKGKY
tara:strand:- start:677 stop:1216 length:540 start_codon:yes stop_codon:yes gene_type:complete